MALSPGGLTEPDNHVQNIFALVDDDQLTHDIVSWILKKTSYESRLFLDASLALENMVERQPRLLLVDFYMPSMTGVEFVRSLQARVSLENTEIMLCSAVAPRAVDKRILAALNITYVDKQVICSKDQLIELLDQSLG